MPLPRARSFCWGRSVRRALVFAALPNLQRHDGGRSHGPVRPRGPPPQHRARPKGPGRKGEAPLDAGGLDGRITALRQGGQGPWRGSGGPQQKAAAGRLTPSGRCTSSGIVADFTGLIPCTQVLPGPVPGGEDRADGGGTSVGTHDSRGAVRGARRHGIVGRTDQTATRATYAEALAELGEASGPVVTRPGAPAGRGPAIRVGGPSGGRWRRLRRLWTGSDWMRKSGELRGEQRQIEPRRPASDLNDPRAAGGRRTPTCGWTSQPASIR